MSFAHKGGYVEVEAQWAELGEYVEHDAQVQHFAQESDCEWGEDVERGEYVMKVEQSPVVARDEYEQ